MSASFVPTVLVRWYFIVLFVTYSLQRILRKAELVHSEIRDSPRVEISHGRDIQREMAVLCVLKSLGFLIVELCKW